MQCKCGSRAINDDPDRLLCDTCWRDAEIERLRGELDECRRLLSTAEDAWECGAWNSLIGMQQLYLTRSWYEAARAAGGGEES